MKKGMSMKNISVYMVVAILALSSCGDFLEPHSPSEYTPKTVEHLNELLLGEAYPTPATNNNLNTLLEVVSDDVSALNYYSSANQANYTSSKAQAIKIMYSWQPQYSLLMSDAKWYTFDMYTPHYDRIVGTNAALDYLDKVSGSANEKDYVEAQARALRGYYYLQLVNIYGAPYNLGRDGLGVPVKIVSGLEDRKIVRNTVGAVYDQIVADFLGAEEAFLRGADNKQFQKNYRANLPMVQLLLARTYLYMEEWEKAAEYAEKVMADSRFSLLDLNSVPLGNLVWNSSNYSREYHNFFTYDNPECIWIFGRAGDIASFTSHMLYRTNTNVNFPDPTLLASSPELVNSFVPEALQGSATAYQTTPDLRLFQYLVQERLTTATVISTRFRPYGKYAVSGGKNYNLPAMGNTDFGQALRLAEAYVIGAEAYAMMYKNGDGTAMNKSLTLLNSLRAKRLKSGSQYIDVSITDADELVQFARDERRREMCVEGLRWFDLRRWGMPEITRTITMGATDIATYKLEQGDPSYIFPIPHTVIEKNSDLEQAPLYNSGAPREPITQETK